MAKSTNSSALEKAKSLIFFEKQDGALCGQHCINNALQATLFSAVELAELARQLDERERETMAAAGVHTKEYKEWMANPSSNFDDSGYFSVQVLSAAFKNFNLELLSLSSDDPRAKAAKANPSAEQLFICHMEDHWFSLRKFGSTWVNLNSTLSGPELLSDTYFIMLLNQLQTDGGKIFLVVGDLPYCEADECFSKLRRTEDGRYLDESKGQKLGSDLDDASAVERGIQLSLAKTPQEALRANRAAFLSRFETSSTSTSSSEGVGTNASTTALAPSHK